MAGLPLVLLGAVGRSIADPDADFRARCALDGVILCEGFDSYEAATFPPSRGGGWPTPANPQCYNPAKDGKTHAFLDRMVYASGDASSDRRASLRLDTSDVAGANVAGDYLIRWPQVFGQNSHFYVQHRLLMRGFVSSGAPWTSPSIGGQGWKTLVLAARNGPLCGGIELATANFYYENQLRFYTRCGSTVYDSFEFGSEHRRQQGDYTCLYKDPDPQVNCAMFHGDRWMTFYYDVAVGAWERYDSHVQVFVDYGEGRGYRQWIDAPGYRLSSNDDASDGWGLADIGNYVTGRTGSAPWPATYSTWYDEFILSTQPIAPPGSGPGVGVVESCAAVGSAAIAVAIALLARRRPAAVGAGQR